MSNWSAKYSEWSTWDPSSGWRGVINRQDFGAEWGVKLSQLVSNPKYYHLIYKNLHQQAVGFQKLLYSAGYSSATLAQQATFLRTSGAKLSGWNKNIRNILGPVTESENFITSWNKLALENKALASARAGMFTSVASNLSRNQKIALGVGVGIAALWALKPLGWFSGRDDEYNSIEGLPHRGQAGAHRSQATDFGSGYQSQEKRHRKQVEERFSIFQAALKKYGLEEGTGHKRITIPKELLSKKDITEILGFQPVKIAIPEAGQKSNVSFRSIYNNYHIHEYNERFIAII